MPYGSAWEEELSLLFESLPPRIASAVKEISATRGDLLEVVLDLGRIPEARFVEGDAVLGSEQVTHEDIEYVSGRVGLFGDDNRAGIERTLHRISAIRNRAGVIVGLTCRVGRAVTGTADIIKDIVVGGKSILMLGPPGIGKTTMLRECARFLADECGKRVVIVDTSNEIGGDGDIPHPGIGKSRRMQVKSPPLQHAVMIEAVENHMPQVIVIDEIGTELEAVAARTIAERGVQLVGTAHGRNLENLLVNPTLNDLLGGIQTVTLSDEEARRRGTQKSVLERKAPPTFDVLVEIQARGRVVVHAALDETVDEALRGRLKAPELRIRDENGDVTTQIDTSAAMSGAFSQPSFENGHGNQRRGRERRRQNGSDINVEQYLSGHHNERGNANGHVRSSQPHSVFPYGVSRSYLEHAIRDLKIPLKVQQHVEDADMVLTLKNYYRRKDSPVRAAESSGIPIHVLRSNTVSQIKGALARVYGVPEGDPVDMALQEALEGVMQAQEHQEDVELSPQNSYVRRLQHQLVEKHELAAMSTGEEPSRRVVILKPTG